MDTNFLYVTKVTLTTEKQRNMIYVSFLVQLSIKA